MPVNDTSSATDLLFTLRDKLEDVVIELKNALDDATDLVLRNELWHAWNDASADLARANRAILDASGGRLVLEPPSEELIHETEDLADRVDGDLRGAQGVDEVVRLVNDLAGAVDAVTGNPAAAQA